MARPLRIEYPGAVYHITSRGNEKKSIFKDEQDREIFLNTLLQVNKRYNWLCHAYCLMNNHYHLVVETPDANLSLGMRQLNGVYTQAFNKRHKRVGHVFQGRYKAVLVQKESHLLELSRYVVLNPVRAQVVKSPAAWKWSSYLAISGREKPHPCLTSGWILRQFGPKIGKAKSKYRRFVREGMGKESVLRKVKAQSVLGEDEFVEQLIPYLKGQKEMLEIPKSQRYLGRPDLDKLFKEDIVKNKQKRDKKITEAIERYGYKQREIADYLGMHYSTVSRLVKKNLKMSRNKT